MRLHAQTAVFENGRVLLPSRAPWLSDYVSELTGFPGTRHDDQIDSTTQALDHPRLKKSMYVAPEVLEKARLLGRRSEGIVAASGDFYPLSYSAWPDRRRW